MGQLDILDNYSGYMDNYQYMGIVKGVVRKGCKSI